MLPGLGLLSDDFTDPYLRIFDITNAEFAYMRDDVAIPLAPFFGTMGVCPEGASEQPVMPPGTSGATWTSASSSRIDPLPSGAGRAGAVLLR